MADGNGPPQCDFGEDGAFVYLHRCGECGHWFRSHAEEESPPVLCHYCFTGNRRGIGPLRRGDLPRTFKNPRRTRPPKEEDL